MKRVDFLATHFHEVREEIPEDIREEYSRRTQVINWGLDNLKYDWYKERMSDSEFDALIDDETKDNTAEMPQWLEGYCRVSDPSDESFPNNLSEVDNNVEALKESTLITEPDPDKVQAIKDEISQVKALIPESTRFMYDTEEKIINFGLEHLPESWYNRRIHRVGNFFNVKLDSVKIKEVEDLTMEDKSYLCDMLEFVEYYICGSKLAPCPRWYPDKNKKLFTILDAAMKPESPAVKFYFSHRNLGEDFLISTLELYKRIINDLDYKVLRNASEQLCEFTHFIFEVMRASAGISYQLAADYAEEYCKRIGSKDANIMLGAYCTYAMVSFTNKHLEENQMQVNDTMIKVAIPMILELRNKDEINSKEGVVEYCNNCKTEGFDYEFPDDYHRYGALDIILPSIQEFVKTTSLDITVSDLSTKMRYMAFFTEIDMDKKLILDRVRALSMTLDKGHPFKYDKVYRYLAYVVTSYCGLKSSEKAISNLACSLNDLKYSCFMDSEYVINRLLKDIYSESNEWIRAKMTEIYPTLCDIVHNKSQYPLCVLYAELPRKSKKPIDLLNISEETKDNLTFVPPMKITESISKLLSPEYFEGLVRSTSIHKVFTNLRDAIDVTMAFVKNSSGYDWNEYMDLRRIQTIVRVALGASEESAFNPSIVFEDTSELDYYSECWVNRIGSIVIESFKRSESAVNPAYISDLSKIHAKYTTSPYGAELDAINILRSFWEDGYDKWLCHVEQSVKLSQDFMTMLENEYD